MFLIKFFGTSNFDQTYKMGYSTLTSMADPRYQGIVDSNMGKRGYQRAVREKFFALQMMRNENDQKAGPTERATTRSMTRSNHQLQLTDKDAA